MVNESFSKCIKLPIYIKLPMVFVHSQKTNTKRQIIKRFMEILLIFSWTFRSLHVVVIAGWKLCEAQP